jgi:hypothetical protein
MADVDFAAGQDGAGGLARRERRARRTRRRLTPESPEEREAQRGPRARRAATALASGGPWQWGWRRQHRRRRAFGCMLWILTLLAVLVVLSVLFGGFQKGSKVGGSGPARVPVTRVAPARGSPAAG